MLLQLHQQQQAATEWDCFLGHNGSLGIFWQASTVDKAKKRDICHPVAK